MLQQTNSLLGTQNQALTNQVRDLEMRIRQLEADLQVRSLILCVDLLELVSEFTDIRRK